MSVNTPLTDDVVVTFNIKEARLFVYRALAWMVLQDEDQS